MLLKAELGALGGLLVANFEPKLKAPNPCEGLAAAVFVVFGDPNKFKPVGLLAVVLFPKERELFAKPNPPEGVVVVFVEPPKGLLLAVVVVVLPNDKVLLPNPNPVVGAVVFVVVFVPKPKPVPVEVAAPVGFEPKPKPPLCPLVLVAPPKLNPVDCVGVVVLPKLKPTAGVVDPVGLLPNPALEFVAPKAKPVFVLLAVDPKLKFMCQSNVNKGSKE